MDKAQVVAVQQLLAEYGHVVDPRDWPRFRELSVPEAVLGHTGFVSGPTLVVDGGLTTGSRENVAPAEHGRWATRQHLIRQGGARGIGPA